MTTKTFRLPSNLSPAGFAFFSAQVPYCSRHITDYELVDSEGGLVLQYELEGDDEAHIEKLIRAYEFAKASEKNYRPKVLFESGARAGGAPEGHSPAAIAQAFRLAEGVYIFGPAFARIMKALDGLFMKLATELRAEEFVIPAYTTHRVLERCNYLGMFPQHLTFASTVERDMDVIKAVNAEGRLAEPAGCLVLTDLVAAPAACLNCYAMFADRIQQQPTVVTVLGSCSRYEAGRMRDPSRLWNFRMREIVYLGTEQGALSFRGEATGRLQTLLERSGLPTRIESATDPFFTSERPKLTTYQRAFDLKYEIIGVMPDGSALAVGSLNYHQQHFGSSFDIRGENGEPVHTACVAFGLERWAYWMISHLGEEDLVSDLLLTLEDF